MIKLNSKTPFAKGDNRSCYVHPYDNDLCIKVLLKDTPPKVQNREISYFNSLIKRSISWDMLSHYKGEVDTDKGKGAIFELVRDYDGNISKTLDHYFLKNDDFSKELAQQVERKIKPYLYKEAIVFRDLITLNILVKKISTNFYKLVVIDGIGHNDFIPFVNYSKYLARKKIVRQWNRKRAKWFDKYENIKGIITNYEDN